MIARLLVLREIGMRGADPSSRELLASVDASRWDALEKAVRAGDPRIIGVRTAVYGDAWGEAAVASTTGIAVHLLSRLGKRLTWPAC